MTSKRKHDEVEDIASDDVVVDKRRDTTAVEQLDDERRGAAIAEKLDDTLIPLTRSAVTYAKAYVDQIAIINSALDEIKKLQKSQPCTPTALLADFSASVAKEFPLPNIDSKIALIVIDLVHDNTDINAPLHDVRLSADEIASAKLFAAAYLARRAAIAKIQTVINKHWDTQSLFISVAKQSSSKANTVLERLNEVKRFGILPQFVGFDGEQFNAADCFPELYKPNTGQ